MFSHPKRGLALLTWCACAAWTCALGCGDGSTLRPPTEPAKVGTGEAGAGEDATAGKSASQAGAGNGANTGEPGASGGVGADGSSGGAPPHADGGSPTEPGAGGDATVEPTPLETACTGQRAFVARSGSFVAPTDKALAQSLNQRIFDRSPITFVLLNDDETPRVAASYSKDSGGAQAFHDGIAPEPTRGWVDGDAFGTETAQPHGYLLVDTDDGPLEVPLDNLSYSVTTSARCSKGVATVAGVIPADRSDLVDMLTGVVSSDPEGPDREGPMDTPVSAIFSVEVAEFDFGSVP